MYDKLIQAGIKGALKLVVKTGIKEAQMSGAHSAAAKHGEVKLEVPAQFFYKQKFAPSQGVAIIAGCTLIYQIRGQMPVPGAFPYRLEFSIPSLTFSGFKGRTLNFLGLKDTFGIEIADSAGTHLMAFASEEVRNTFLVSMNTLKARS